MNHGALDAELVADEEQWQAVLGHEARAFGIDCSADRDRFALAGERIFFKPKAEGVELRSGAGIGGHFAICKTKPLGLADGFFPLDHPLARLVAGERAEALSAGEFLENDKARLGSADFFGRGIAGFVGERSEDFAIEIRLADHWRLC